MAKVSRPIIYAAVLGAAAYGVFVLTEPAAPPKKKTVKKTVTATADKDGIAAIDLKTRFPRYSPKQVRDPFLPRVVALKALPAPAAKPAPTGPVRGGTTGNWVLTGITAINNTKSALLENGTGGDSVFLKAGDRWNGMRVAAVGESTIRLVDASGRQIALGFPEPPDPTAPAAPGAPRVPGGPNLNQNTQPGAPITPGALPQQRPPSQVAAGQRGGVNGT